jgi:hypothetical protein
MDKLELHPLADLFPMMTDVELDELGEDMLKHGQREPIWLYEGKILDGRNRYRACLMKGIEPVTTETRVADPLAFVISLNLKRRHLDASQRAMVVAEIAKLPKGAHPPIGGSSPTQDVAAKLLNVSVRSGQRARYVKDHGTPDLVDAVKHGDVRVAAAVEFAKQNPPLDQHRLIAEHGSPAAAVQATVKAKADRAVSKIPRPVADPRPAADRAEARTRLDAARAAYIAAIEAANLDMLQRVAEIRTIEDAIGVNLIPIRNAPARSGSTH